MMLATSPSGLSSHGSSHGTERRPAPPARSRRWNWCRMLRRSCVSVSVGAPSRSGGFVDGRALNIGRFFKAKKRGPLLRLRPFIHKPNVRLPMCFVANITFHLHRLSARLKRCRRNSFP